MAERQHLLVEHLENVAWNVLELYPSVVKELIRGRSGVYALYKGNRLYYVGLATDLMRRVKQHNKDRHRGAWNRFSVYLSVEDEHIKDLESLLIRIVKPKGNRQGGRFAKSQNLRPRLLRAIKEADGDRRAKLLGGHVAKQSRKRKVKAGQLVGLVERAIKLKGWSPGWEFTATLRKNGTITYGNYIYDDPTTAATDAVGRRRNGWRFWHFRNKRGEWVPLEQIE